MLRTPVALFQSLGRKDSDLRGTRHVVHQLHHQLSFGPELDWIPVYRHILRQRLFLSPVVYHQRLQNPRTMYQCRFCSMFLDHTLSKICEVTRMTRTTHDYSGSISIRF
jgi:hypothetical protein